MTIFGMPPADPEGLRPGVDDEATGIGDVIDDQPVEAVEPDESVEPE